MKIQFEVTSKMDGNRLDCVVAAQSDKFSRSSVAQSIKNGDILVSDRIRKPSYKVRMGDLISGFIADENRYGASSVWDLPFADSNMQNSIVDAELIGDMKHSLSFYILYEDEYILVIDKKPNAVVHPAPGNLSGTVVNDLLSYCPEIRCVGEDPSRPGIVHRLDKDTSGVMVVAKENRSFFFLKKEFMQRRIEKRYLAIISGNINNNAGMINLPIGRHPVKRKTMSTLSLNGRYAETLWKVKQRYDGATLIEAELKTGRTHQVRVHFKALGHPLIGDKVYGFKKKHRKRFNDGFKRDENTYDEAMIQRYATRQMLHAWKLSFRHPWSGRRVKFIAPVPHDMAKFIDGIS